MITSKTQDSTARACAILDRWGVERLSERKPVGSIYKFDTLATELLYELSLSSFYSDDIGSADELGHYALFAPTDHDAYGAIVFSDDCGFVGLEAIGVDWEIRQAWHDIEALYGDYYAAREDEPRE